MRSVAALLLAATLAALTGCSAAEPAPPAATPSVTPRPVFASDEEALAAAEKAYTEYLAVLDAVLNGGGSEADAISDVAAGDALEDARFDAENFRNEKVKSVGVRSVANVILQSFDGAQVRLYVCEDVSAVDLLDAEGRSLVSSSRPPRQAFEAAVESESLLVVERLVRDNEGVCP